MADIDFLAVIQSSPNAYMLLDPELGFVWANDAWLRVTQSRLEDLVGRHLLDAFPNDPSDPGNRNARLLRESLEAVRTTGKPDVLALLPYRVPRGDGVEERLWSATHSPVFDGSGRLRFILQHTVDVTELQSREQASADVLGRARQVQETGRTDEVGWTMDWTLDAERQRLRLLFLGAPGFVSFLRGPDHVFELVNAAYTALVGDRELLGRPIREALPELVGQGWFEQLDRVFATGRPYVARARRAEIRRQPGEPLVEVWLDIVCQPIVEADGRVSGVFVQGHDITTQRSLELERVALLDREHAARTEVQTANRRQQLLAELIPQQVWTALPSGELDFVNERVLHYFGATRDEILGSGWQSRVHPDDLPRCIAAWTHSLATGDEYEVEFRLQGTDGAYRWHLGRALSLRDESGTITGWFGSNTDIDDARTSRDQLEQRAEFEQQLIGIVSHDLRNPLNAIAMSATLLLRRGNLDDHQGRGVARIVSASDRAGRLIRDLLDFSQARSVGRIPIQLGDVNLREIATHVVDEIHLAWPDRRATVAHHGRECGRWDSDRLSQLLGNLVTNAFQHSPVGAAIRVLSRGEEDGAVIDVHNDGPPIPEPDRSRLFVPFQRGGDAEISSGRSIGLGLYIATLIVSAHGGTLSFTSEAGQGTRFRVWLPWEAPPASETSG